MNDFLIYLKDALGEYEIIENTGTSSLVLELKSSGRQAVVKKTNDLRLYERLKGLYIEGIPAVYSVFSHNGEFYCAEEYIEGITVSDAVKKYGAFYSSEAVEIITGLCTIIAELNSNGIYGADISPENIILSKGKPYIIRPEGPVENSFYIPPEADSQFQPNEKSDVYALGRLLGFLVSGDTSYKPDMILPYCKIIKKATQSKPEKRYKSSRTMKKAFGININTLAYVVIFIVLIITAVYFCGKYSFKINSVSLFPYTKDLHIF